MGRRRYKGPTYGPFFFNINKPVGITSFDVIRKLQRNLPHAIGKIGHFGTLDPFADGVLLIGIGSATRLNLWTQDVAKVYEATGVFGVGSATGDNTAGEDEYETDECFKSDFLSFELVKQKLESFLGKYSQVPHMYSATKHEGKTLYQWAREGVQIKKDPVEREVYSIELIELEGDKCKFRVSSSSGTYIRVLFEDLAKKLGTNGHLVALKRISIGDHHIDNSVNEQSWPTHFDEADKFLESFARPISDIVKLDRLELSGDDEKKYSNGVKLTLNSPDQDYWVYAKSGLLGVGRCENGVLSGAVNFVPAASGKIDLSIRNSLD